MSRTRLALAASALMLTSIAALAAPSYESRGYGGPLYIGPNFHQGGQSSPPAYDGSRSYSVERYRAPQRLDRVQRKRSSDDGDVKTAKKTEPSKEATEAKSENENSSIVSIGSHADKKPIDTPKADTPKTDTAKADAAKSSNENSTIASVASSTAAKADPVKADVTTKADTDGAGKPTGCKRYFPTIGQTLSVPCD
jgi:hypothetical protein